MSRFEPKGERCKSKGSVSFGFRSTFKNWIQVRKENLNAVHIFN